MEGWVVLPRSPPIPPVFPITPGAVPPQNLPYFFRAGPTHNNNNNNNNNTTHEDERLRHEMMLMTMRTHALSAFLVIFARNLRKYLINSFVYNLRRRSKDNRIDADRR